MKVYPNPSNGLFNLPIEFGQQQDIQMKVYALTGEEIQSKRFQGIPGMQQTITLENQPAGVYFLVLQLADGRSYAGKLIKE
jgi:hypothetical protein